MSFRLLTISLRCCMLLLISGCASFSAARLWGPKVEFADARNPAADIICMWEPGEGRDSEGKPARGFSGTILFFDRTHTAPIGVHGSLTFYVYDDYGPRETWSEPIAEYSFTPQQWNQFFAMGPLGASYRIFIPYPRNHPYQVNTSLWAKFEPADGQPAFYSKRVPIVLPGPLMEDDRVQVLETTEMRGYDPKKMQEIVTAAFSESDAARSNNLRAETLHRWDPASPNKVLNTTNIELANYQVTQGGPAGASAGSSTSAPGAGPESWGSTPPALSFESESGRQPDSSRKRFKLNAAE